MNTEPWHRHPLAIGPSGAARCGARRLRDSPRTVAGRRAAGGCRRWCWRSSSAVLEKDVEQRRAAARQAQRSRAVAEARCESDQPAELRGRCIAHAERRRGHAGRPGAAGTRQHGLRDRLPAGKRGARGDDRRCWPPTESSIVEQAALPQRVRVGRTARPRRRRPREHGPAASQWRVSWKPRGVSSARAASNQASTCANWSAWWACVQARPTRPWRRPLRGAVRISWAMACSSAVGWRFRWGLACRRGRRAGCRRRRCGGAGSGRSRARSWPPAWPAAAGAGMASSVDSAAGLPRIAKTSLQRPSW